MSNFKVGQWVTVENDPYFVANTPYQIRKVFADGEMHLWYDGNDDYEVVRFTDCTLCEPPTTKDEPKFNVGDIVEIIPWEGEANEWIFARRFVECVGEKLTVLSEVDDDGDVEIEFKRYSNFYIPACQLKHVDKVDMADSYEKAREADRIVGFTHVKPYSVACTHGSAGEDCPVCDFIKTHGSFKAPDDLEKRLENCRDLYNRFRSIPVIMGTYGPNSHEECAEARNLSTCSCCKRVLPAKLVGLIESGDVECPHCKQAKYRCKHKTCRGLLVKDYNPNTGKWFTRCQDCGGEQ